jgi:ketosteroid isomerase-like protein
MRATLAVRTTIAFLAVLTTGFVVRDGQNIVSKPSDTLAADRAGIEKLRKADIEATLTQDPSALTALWSEDGVNLQSPAGPVVGLKALNELYARFRGEHPEFKVLEYSPEFKDLQIMDGWAIESVDANGTFRMAAKDDPVTIQQKLLRVLKRQSDGSWKFAMVSPR